MIEARWLKLRQTRNKATGIDWAERLSASAGKTFSAVHPVTTNTSGNVPLSDFALGTPCNPISWQFQQTDPGHCIPPSAMSATLRLLNEDNDAEFLANPRIVTADNLQAKIEINRAQPVPQLNFNEQTATAVSVVPR